MKKFQLNKVTYSVPTSWSEVTLRHQINVEQSANKIIDNEALRKIAYISGYCNIPLEVLKKTPMPKINKLFQHLKFTNEELPTKPIQEFTFKGEKYTVMNSLLESQFQDFVSCETALQNFKDSPTRALPYIIAILAKKENETLDDYDIEKRAEHFMELPLTIVEPLRVFFYAIENWSQLHTQLSSMEGRQAILNAKASVLKNTLSKRDGLGWLRNLLRLMLLRLVKSYEKNWNKFFRSIQSKSSKTN
jgi:hypothetical protein